MKKLTALFFILVVPYSYGQVVIRGGGASSGGYGKPKQEAPLPLYENNTFVEKSRDVSKLDLWNSFTEQMEIHNINPFDLFKTTLWTDGSSIVIEDYKSFLMNEDVDGNIYSHYLNSRKEVIDDNILKELHSYWQTDLNTPSLYPHYQSSDGLDWNAIESHIREALEESMSVESLIESMEMSSLFKFRDRVYVNPYRNDIEGIWKNNNSWIDMERIKRNLPSPSMVDFAKREVQSIVFDDGQKWTLDKINNIRELSVMPHSKKSWHEE